MEIHWMQTTVSRPWTKQTMAHDRDRADLVSAWLRVGAPVGLPMLGFGGCFNELGWVALQKIPEVARNEVMDALFDREKGCAFNYCRLPIGANDYSVDWYSHNEHDGDLAMEHFSIRRDHRHLLPFIREGLARCPEMELFASPWSPPTWMKFPKAYNAGTLIQSPGNLSAYALYFRKFVEAYAAEGVRIGAVHVQNEPNSDQKFPSCVWTPPQMRDFIRDHLGPEFARSGVDCEIWLGTIERGIDQHGGREGYKDWAGYILDDEQVRKIVKGVGYQWAGKGAVQRTHLAYPDLPIVQTENECCDGTNAWHQAHYVFDLIWHYLQNGALGYVYWNMVLERGGASTWGWNQNAMITIDPESGRAGFNPEYHLMRHFSAHVRRGARRLELSGNWCVNALGFVNPDGETVLVLQNASRTRRTLELTLADGSVCQLTLEPESFHTLLMDSKGNPEGTGREIA